MKRLSMPRSRARKGGSAVGPTKRGKGTKIVAIASGDRPPLAVTVESASPAECRLVEAVLAGCFLDELPARLIGDKAYDSDTLDREMSELGIEMISPNSVNRKTQDGRSCSAPLSTPLEGRAALRMDAKLPQIRHTMGSQIENFLGFVHLACLLISLGHL